jgi:transcriptional regulator with XRE-family HTH domain
MQVVGMADFINALDRYLAERGMTNVEFGRAVDASEATISRLRKGKQAPSYSLVLRIRDATKGAVTADDFLPASPAPAEGAAA